MVGADVRIDTGGDRVRTVGRRRATVGTILSGRETWLDDAAATPRDRARVLMPGTMEAVVSTYRGAHRLHVDLLRVTSASCRG
jgi:hypothetical protein